MRGAPSLAWIALGLCAAFVVAAASAASSLAPPVLKLKGKAGTQAGAQGSSCVTGGGVSQCADTVQPHPTKVSVVRPGGRLTLVASGATLSGPSAAFGALGCEGSGRSTPIRRRHAAWWIVAPRRSGAYELQVFTNFRTHSLKGDTSVAFGVLVSRTKPRRVVPAAPYEVC